MEALTRLQPEAGDDQEKDKKKRKKGAKLSLVPFADLGEKREDGKDKPRPTKALADLLITKREETESEKPTDKVKVAREKATPESDTSELDDKKSKEYEPLPGYEPGPTEFSGGEVIIHLNGDAPIAERVIPLHAEQPDEKSAEEFDARPLEARLEQQDLAHDESSQPEEVPTAGGGGGEVPPTDPPEGPPMPFEQPPEPEQPEWVAEETRPEPAQAFREYMQRQAAAREAAASEQAATRQDVNNAVYEAAKKTQRRERRKSSLALKYEHLRHRRREQKAEKRAKAQGKQLESARQDYQFGLREQERQQAEASTRLGVAERRVEGAEKRFAEQAHRAEQAAQEAEQRLKIPAEHRLQTSAWHTIEVDAKTGKPVENPTFQYGQEYHRERAQETMPVQQRNAAAGEVALVAAATNDAGGQPDGVSLPPVNLPNASMQGRPLQPSSQQPTRAKQKTTVGSGAGPLWPWLIALLLIAISLIVVLH